MCLSQSWNVAQRQGDTEKHFKLFHTFNKLTESSTALNGSCFGPRTYRVWPRRTTPLKTRANAMNTCWLSSVCSPFTVDSSPSNGFRSTAGHQAQHDRAMKWNHNQHQHTSPHEVISLTVSLTITQHSHTTAYINASKTSSSGSKLWVGK